MTVRIYADFNSGGAPGKGPCWCLRYGNEFQPLDEVAGELGLQPGMQVTLYYEEPSEEFEVSATLERNNGVGVQWSALPDWSTRRRIRG
jgi:hypothetical protein